MRKVGNKNFEDFPAAKLYLDDLKCILAMLQENCEKVEVRTGEFDEISPPEIDDVVAQMGSKRFADLYIKAYRPFVSIDIRTYGISAYLSNDDVSQHGILSKLREIVESRKKKHFGKLTNIIGMAPTIGIGIAISEGEWAIAGMCLSLVLLLFWPILKYQMAYKVVVLTSSKSDEKSFFVRRKDDIAVSIGSALLGAIVSFTLFKYFGQA
jgi:hypothetical protein